MVECLAAQPQPRPSWARLNYPAQGAKSPRDRLSKPWTRELKTLYIRGHRVGDPTRAPKVAFSY